VKDSSDIYKSMLIGVAIFAGGMVAVLLLIRYLQSTPAAHTETQQHIKPIIPLTIPMLTKINDSINNQVPAGTFENRTLIITDTITLLDEKRDGGLNYTSVDLTNNGPAGVYFSVNTWNWAEAPLPAGQSINIDLKKRGAIKKMYFKTDTGTTATINLYIMK
jgi:hypothetical protein